MRIENVNDNEKNRILSGVSFNGNIEIFDTNDSVLRYLINGIIMFFITYGCIGCFISSFSISYKKAMLIFVLFVLAIAYSFMHINAMAHRIGYIVILISYLYVVLKLKLMIKSGFARIVNETFEKISDTIYVSKVRKYTEYVDDYKLATTLCLIIIGFVLLLILNIIISEYLNVIATLILTLPFVSVGLYFGYSPSISSLIMYIVAIVGLIVLRSNSKATIHSTNILYDLNEKSQFKIYELTTLPKVHAQIMLVIMVSVAVLSGIFTLQLKDRKYSENAVMTAVKTNLNNKIGKMIAYDVEDGNDISIAGGLSEGRLGSVPSVQFDNEDDLIVNFVPKSNETVYLRGYIGSIYKDNSWLMISETEKIEASNNLTTIKGMPSNERVNATANLLKTNYGVGANNSLYTMTVTNVGASKKYVYTPYYTQVDQTIMNIQGEDEIKAVEGRERYTLKYYPFSYDITDTTKYYDNYYFNESVYAEYVNAIYKQVPEKNKKILDAICKEQGFNASDTNIVQKVQNYFKSSYIYSLKCGTTPDDEDFVNYFIENKKGFCAHFASTGALLLRYLGIPARYVEGYVITEDIMKEAKEYGMASDYIIDTKETNINKSIEVNVKDNKAHAWVEVYKKGFGWVPYEMTYYSSVENVANEDEEDNEKKYISVFDSFVVDVKGFFGKCIKNIKNHGVTVLIIAAFSILIIGITVLSRIVIAKVNRNKAFSTPEYSKNIMNMSYYLFKVFAVLGYKKEKGMTIDEYFIYLYKNKLVSKDVLKKLSLCMRKACYASTKISEHEYESFKEDVENIVEIQYNELSLKDKFKFRIVYTL